MANDDNLINIFEKTIFSYTRAQAIRDGFLIDITTVANKAGFKIPIAVTHTVWNKYITWINDNAQEQTKQDLDNRLQNMLGTLRAAIKKVQNAACILYELTVMPRNEKSKKGKRILLKAVLGADENGEAVITIMLPDED